MRLLKCFWDSYHFFNDTDNIHGIGKVFNEHNYGYLINNKIIKINNFNNKHKYYL